MDEDPKVCVDCKAEIEPLADFPGPRCLPCYSKTPEANAPLTADDIVAMWGGPVRKKS